MNSTRLIVSVLAFVSCGLWGCADLEYRPSPEQVESFLKRRAFVVSAVNDIKEPMVGTSYPRHSEDCAAKSEDRIKQELGYPDDEEIRREIKQFGHFFQEPRMGLEFDVDLSDQLTKDAEGGAIAGQLHNYYARRLKDAGWYMDSSGSVLLSPNTVTYTSRWTDRGEGSNTSIQRPGHSSLSTQFTIHEPQDTRRGYFRVLVAVRVDTDVKRAHITINYWWRIGR